MESILLNAFSEHLSKIIIGFRRDQINSSLLTGRGEITSVDLNCNVLNDILRSYTPLVELESVHVTRLGFNVTSFTNIKKAPVEVLIDEIHVKVVECLEYRPPAQSSNVDPAAAAARAADGLVKRPYGLMDRIGDNLHVEINRIFLTFQPLGKFKTRRTGPWTPPAVGVTLRNFRFVSVDEFGEEGTPEQVWRHNDRDRRQKRAARNGGGHNKPHDIFIYKKLTLHCSMGLRPPVLDGSGSKPPTKLLLKSVPVEVHVTMQKRKTDAAFLAAQSDVVVDHVEVEMDHNTVPLLAQMAAAMQFLVCKDRSFVDPLKPDGNGGDNGDDEGIEMTLEEEEESDEAARKTKLSQGVGAAEDNGDVAEDDADADDASESSSDEEDEEEISTPATDAPPVSATATSDGGKKFYPAYVFQSGIIIYDRISISLSVHHCSLRAWYPSSFDGGGYDGGGYLQCVLKGLVTEAIWPPRPGDRGGIAQVSLSYISLQERHGKALRPLLYGGQQAKAAGVSAFNRKKAENEKPDMMEAAPEITFPLFEDRSIRLDGYGRESLPSQAIGLKVTVDVQDHDDPAKRAEGKTQTSFLNECGMDRIDIILDAEAYCRVLSFCMNGEEGIDKRLFSGDWKEWITPDMFVSSLPSGVIPSLEPYLQPMPELFLDENHLISSELFNLTSKMTNIRLSLPAPVHKDVKTSSVVVCLSDMMVLVSSALPKTILSGVISPSSEDSDQAQSYPNDPSDISANVSRMNEIMSAGVDAKQMRSSTFRVQVTMDGLTVEARPAIPLHDALECQSIILPTKMSFLGCIDVSAPPTAHTRKAMGIAVHLSAHLQKLQLNLDFDVIVGIVGCLMHHAGCFQKAIQSVFSAEKVQEKFAVDQKLSVEEAGGGSLDRVLKSQVSRSFEKGIVVTLACIHIDELDVRVWRQECNIMTSDTGDDAPTASHPILLLARLGLKRFQLSGEAGKGLVGINSDASRFTAKVGLSSLQLDLCDPTLIQQQDFACNAGDGNGLISSHLLYMTEILSLGSFDENDGRTNDVEDGFSFIRLDYDDESKSATGSVDINSPGVFHLKLDAVQQIIVHTIEGLFIPTGIHQCESTSATGIFPDGSLGSFMLALINPGLGENREEAAFTKDDEAKKQKSLVESIQAMAFRFTAKNLALVIPISQQDENNDSPSMYRLQLSNAACVLGYFRENGGRMVGSWSARKSGPDRAWSSEFEDYALGVHVRVNSSQCVSQIADAGDAASSPLVRPFNINGAYHPETAKMNMGPVELSFGEAQILKQIASTGTGLGKNAYEIYLDVASLHSSIDLMSGVEEKTSTAEKSSPAEIATREAAASITSAQSLLTSLENAASSLDIAVPTQNEAFSARAELEKAKAVLFLLERQRAAALALVSARVCGWIRMGASNVNGQRMTTSTNLWRYWAVLRKNLLIVSERPGGSKLIDIVPLREVTLHSITGQNRRTEVARGFALRDSRGYERVFSCATGEDYEAWVRSISEIAKKPHSSTDLDNTESPTSIENVTQANLLEEMSTTAIANPPRERLPSGESLPGNTDRRQLMKSKLSSVKDQTKNRMGAAVQSAKESQRGGRLMAKMAEAKASANAKLGEAKASANAKLEEAATAVRTASDISSTSGSGSPSAGERRVGRMSKLGAQVKSVKLDGARVEKMTQAMKSVKLDGQALSRLNSASFQQPHPSFRSSGGSSLGENGALGQPALQVKSLQSLPLAPTVKQSDLPEVELKRIPGTRNVNVEMIRLQENETTSDDVVGTGDEPTSADTSVEDSQENAPKTKPFPWTYQITIQPLQTHHAEPTKKTYCRSLEDILKFYADIAQSIYSVRGYDSEYSLDEQKDDFVDFSSIDAALRNQLAVVSQVLHGLLELSKESLESEDVRNYQCEMLAAFANSVISSPLPDDAMGVTLAFFGLSTDFGIDAAHCLARYEYNSSQSVKAAISPQDNNVILADLHGLISKCQSELAKASRQVLISSSVSSAMSITTGREKSGPKSSALTFGSGKVDAMQTAMHKALISAMAERDEAHSQLVASSVLHVTEMEEERKKNDRLTRKLVVAEKLNAETGAGGSFFLGKDEIAQKHNISANAMQSSDEELLAMCRQLSNEIAEKTNASLEILRLKESHKIERDAEKARREEMQNQIDELKRQVAAEKSRRQESEKETDKWKSSFNKAVSSDIYQ